jgi:hypothetical protein
MAAPRVPDDYAPSTSTKIGKSPLPPSQGQTGSTTPRRAPDCAGSSSDQPPTSHR